MSAFPTLPREAFGARWARLARAVGLAPDEPVAVALSGGADSVLLAHLVAAARPRPRACAIHVDHGLRGPESDEDARFCARLAAGLALPFVRRRIVLERERPSLEAQAREARYAALAEEASRLGFVAIATGHHADDALETLLMRWTRGAPLGGLSGPRANRPLEFTRAGSTPSGRAPRLVRPLLSMRREEVRRLLSDHGLSWREDRSNEDLAFVRNRVRHAFLPELLRLGGEPALENLRAFAREVEDFEERLAAGTAHLAWDPPEHAAACLARGEATHGGSLARAALTELVAPLRRRALWRLIAEGTGRAPSRAVLEELLEDLALARVGRRNLPGGFSLWLRRERLHLCPPRPAAPHPPPEAGSAPGRQLRLDFASALECEPPADLSVLSLPGSVRLGDGRTLLAELVEPEPGLAAPRSATAVELDAAALAPGESLWVRFPRPGDRLRPLGAPGRRRLVRFLADLGVPREDRARVPLVVRGSRGGEILWVAGLRPAEEWRVGPHTRRRLSLRLVDAAPAPLPRERSDLWR